MQSGRLALSLSVPLSILLALSSWAGMYVPSIYAREKPIRAAQGIGGDAVALYFYVPLLLVSAAFAWRGSIAARLLWMGTVVCILYNAVSYTLAVHFNALFLAYCGVLGFSFYALIWSLTLNAAAIAEQYGPALQSVR